MASTPTPVESIGSLDISDKAKERDGLDKNEIATSRPSTVHIIDGQVKRKDQDEMDRKETAIDAFLQSHPQYVGNVTLFSPGVFRNVWRVGNDYFLKESVLIHPRTGANFDVGQDVVTTNYVRENTTIPVPATAQEWRDGSTHFILMRTMPGETVQMAWPRLSVEEKKTLAREVVEYLVQLRTHTAPTAQTVNGSPAPNLLFKGSKDIDIGEDKETWWARVKDRFPRRDSAWREELKAQYPDHAGPYVLTHCDLNTSNIMVHDGHVSGIIDWECSGYYPIWWEHVIASAWLEEREWANYLMNEMNKRLGESLDELRFYVKFQNNYWSRKDCGRWLSQ